MLDRATYKKIKSINVLCKLRHEEFCIIMKG